jgi:hypothetical protein
MRQRHVPKKSVPAPVRPTHAWLAWGQVALLILLATVPYKVGVNDTWTHIALGRFILTQGIPYTDPFSYLSSSSEQPYTEHEWAAAVVVAWIFDTLGAPGLLLWKVTLVSVTVALTVSTARRFGASWPVLALTLPAALVIGAGRMVERPHLYSSGFLAIYLWLYGRVRTGACHPGWLLLLLPCHVVWVNVHGGQAQGLALLGVIAAAETLHWWRGEGALPGRVVGLLLALPLACLIAGACLNPYGAQMLRYPLREGALQARLDWNPEWLPWHRGRYYSYAGWAYVALLATLWLSWLRLHRAPRWLRGTAAGAFLAALLLARLHPPPPVPFARPPPVDGGQWLLLGLEVVMVGLWLGFALTRWRTMDLAPAVVVAFVVTLAWRYARGMADAALLCLPWLTATLTRLSGTRRWIRPLGLGVTVCAAALLLLPPRDTSLPPFGAGLNVPPSERCIADFFVREHLQGRVLTDKPNWLLLRTYPNVRVAHDVRMYVAGDRIEAWLAAVRGGAAALRDYLARSPADFLSLRPRILGDAQYQMLMGAGWRFVYLDDQRYVLASPKQAAQLERLTYHHILPWLNLDVTPRNAPAVLQEADRALNGCPASASFAHAYRAQALSLLGLRPEAEQARRLIPPRLLIE